jgi:hypothetical protein
MPTLARDKPSTLWGSNASRYQKEHCRMGKILFQGCDALHRVKESNGVGKQMEHEKRRLAETDDAL